MPVGFFEKIFGIGSGAEIKKINPIVQRIEALEDEYRALSDSALKAKTGEFKERLSHGETMDDILPEAYAALREASDRVLGMRPFRVQLIGGIVLHQGRIAEMKTGEGKTLVAILPAYLNALTGEGVHIVTVNDYLARRDSEWMGKVYRYMGLSVGLNVHGLSHEEKKAAYAADITYGTNNEFGFDYLRDNMVIYKEQIVQRSRNFAIVDEVDSILIDEARTPLIISGSGDESTDMYEKADRFVRSLKREVVKSQDSKRPLEEYDADYVVDEKDRNAVLTPRGIKRAEQAFGVENLNDPENTTLLHHINQAIRAHGVMRLDVDYVIKDGQIIIVDEFTGRLMFGRRYSNGLHQAIEAKEGVKVERESKTLATITFQNFFRLYNKLSGMTGTALTEEDEFQHIYKLDVVEIPTNRPVVRIDHPDSVYKTVNGKNAAIIRQIQQCHAKGQPVLVGTISIEKSEQISAALKRVGIPHHVLNAKHHDREAEIVAQAGKLGAVTIATNMAGRGTDIVLGGNPEYMAKAEMRKNGFDEALIAEATGHAETDDEAVLSARAVFAELYKKYKAQTDEEAKKVRKSGGLFILGTERHESRRIDNQLRGRSGRQGDPGESKFYLSLQDDIMRLFGSERVMGIMNALGMPEDEPIEHKMLSKTIENAQKRVEGINFDRRKHVLQYDDVMNKQREVIYSQRKKVLDGEDMKQSITKMLEEAIDRAVEMATAGREAPEEWDFNGILGKFRGVFLNDGDLHFTPDQLDTLDKNSLRAMLVEKAMARYEQQEAENTPELMRELERVVLLRTVDRLWMDHIDAMDDLRQGIGLRAFGQHDPVVAYRLEGYEMFEEMIEEVKYETVRLVLTMRVRREGALQRQQVAKPTREGYNDGGKKISGTVRKEKKPGRNAPCPCGSGKKYKRCCGIDD